MRRYLANTSWLIGEKAIRLLLGLLVTLFVARYLGPAAFGILAYALSMKALFAVAGHLGLGSIVVRNIIKEPDELGEVIGTATALKALGVLVGFLLLLAVALITETAGSIEFWVLVLVATAMLFKPLEVVDYWFQSRVESRYPVIARTTGLLIGAAIKVALVFAGAALIYFALAGIVQAMIAAALMLWFYRRATQASPIRWKFSAPRALKLLKLGALSFAGTILALVYLKIDQVMLRWMIGAEEVGVYSIAVAFSEAWYVVPAAIMSTFFPSLVSLQESDAGEYNRRLQQLLDFLLVSAIGVAVVVTFGAQWAIDSLLGSAYSGAAQILVIHVWAALFVFMRAAFSKWIVIEGLFVFSLVTQGIGALVNVGLNFLLIPQYAGTGAAVATLISYAAAGYLSLLLHPATRPMFWKMSLAFLAPVRYPYRALLRAGA